MSYQKYIDAKNKPSKIREEMIKSTKNEEADKKLGEPRANFKNEC